MDPKVLKMLTDPEARKDPRQLQAAMQAMHSDKRALLLKRELEHLASNNLPALKGLIRKVTRRVPELCRAIKSCVRPR